MNTNSTQYPNATTDAADLHVMDFGKHQGKRMKDVPALWLLWFFNADHADSWTRWYVAHRLEALKAMVPGFSPVPFLNGYDIRRLGEERAKAAPDALALAL